MSCSQSLPEGEASSDRPAGGIAENFGTGWNKGGAGDRGSQSSPDPEPEVEWIWWAFKIWWLSIGRLADTGLVWCGTLCASVRFAAQWSYWLLVAIVGVFIFQLLIWTVTWVLCPCWRHVKAVVRYIFGKGGWHEVAQLHGISVFRPRTVGPRGQDEWSAEYGAAERARTRPEPRTSRLVGGRWGCHSAATPQHPKRAHQSVWLQIAGHCHSLLVFKQELRS